MKKLISIILALALIVALVPAAFAAVSGWESVDDVYTYEFTQASHGISTDRTASVLNNDSHKIEKTAEGYLPWGYVGSLDRASLGTTTTAELIWTFYLDTVEEDVGGVTNVHRFNPEESRNQRALMLELEIKTAGTFRPIVTYTPYPASCIMEYHLVKKKSNETGYDSSALSDYVKKLGNESRLGVVDQSTGSGSFSFSEITVEKGNYYLVAIPLGSNKNCVFNRNAATASSNPGRCYAVNYMKAFSLFSDADSGENEEVQYDFITNSQSFRLSNAKLSNNEAAPEGYLGYWGGDSSTNSNRTSPGGWVGSTANSLTSAVIRNATTYGADAPKYLDPDKTAPWGYFNKGVNNTYIDAVRVYMNSTVSNTNSANNKGLMMFKINIPKAGKYTLTFTGERIRPKAGVKVFGADGNIHLIRGTQTPSNSNVVAGNFIGTYKFYKEGLNANTSVVESETYTGVEVHAPGTYHLVIQLRNDLGAKEYANLDIPKGTTASEYASHYEGRVRAISLKRVGDVDSAQINDDKREEAENIDGGNVTPEDIDISTDATVSALAAYLGGGEISSEIISVGKVNAGEEVTLTAPTDKAGYKFLYWAKAGRNSKIVVTDNPEYTFKPALGVNNSYIAVYKAEGVEEEAKAEFYDANGQLLETLTEDGTVPSLPTLPGFGKAKYWVSYSGKETLEEGDSVAISGTKMYMAYYEEEIVDSVSVTINGKKENAEYGNLYELTASLRDPDDSSKVFCYWQKNGEIVSFGKTYSFRAAEDCVVEAVYGEYAPIATELRKVIFSNIANGSVHAEFIGLSDAVEKGILFGGNSFIDASARIAMKGNGNQFTFVDDVAGEPIGYAILASGKVVYSK